jgi:DNA polymerase-4
MPIERMWGIGPKTAPVLRARGYRTLGDLAKADPAVLERVMGSWGVEIRELARGNDPREVVPDREAKSIGAENTYEVDLTTREAIARTLLAHASRVAERLTASGLVANAVVVKLKRADFTVLTRRMTLPAPASDTRTIHDACLVLLDRFPLDGMRVRLTGVAAQDLGPLAPTQGTLFRDETAERRRDVQKVLLQVKERYGNRPLTFASLLDETDDRVAPEGNLEEPPRRR